MKKILIVYYTQSGQIKEILDQLTKPLQDEAFELTFEELRPVDPFPFPWSNDSFFDAFPESALGIPCRLKPMEFDPDKDYDLIILAYQAWFLSPSIPFWSFMLSDHARKVISGKPVITLLGVRNMWIMAQERVRNKIRDYGGKLEGNIVLQDRHQNLISVITIVHWLYTGDKGSFGVFPPAGVSGEDIMESVKFGHTIRKAILEDDLDDLQDKLVARGAVKIVPDLMSTEKKAIHMFRAWAKFVRKKGAPGDPSRKARTNLFRIYLFTVIYLVSPIVSMLFYLTWVFAFRRIRKNIRYYRDLSE